MSELTAAHSTLEKAREVTNCPQGVELQEHLKALVAESLAMKAERADMVEIGELIRTQDNRITDQPFFAVMTKREIITSEDHDYDRICWVENQSGDYVEASDTQHRRLEAIYQGLYKVRDGWDRYAMKEIDVFVTGCFTEQGCKDYISRNGHNLNKPFIYAFGSYRNDEYQKVRKFIMGMPETPATDSILRKAEARGRIEGINFAASRLAAAYNHGFIDKPLPEVFDVVRMILTAKEDLANTPAEDGLSGEYAEQALEDWEAELSEGNAE